MKLCSCRDHFLTGFELLIVVFECTVSLELLEFYVPAHVPLGARALLSCRWRLGAADALYSVKWYKDGREFFRHVPRHHEPRRKFPLPGVDVESSDSTGSNITLKAAMLETGGRYRCEVSGERPLFPTISDHADMEVLVVPDHGPIVSGFRARYHPEDHVFATCTSGLSRPSTNLTWYINGEQAPSDTVHTLQYDKINALDQTSLRIEFFVKEHHFKRGLKIKCLATLGSIYWRSTEESALIDGNILDKLITSSTEWNTRADRVQSLNNGYRVTVTLAKVFIVYLIV